MDELENRSFATNITTDCYATTATVSTANANTD
jgi:hypothetical protein